MAYNFEETKQSERLLQEPGHLLKIYREQFEHLRHIENSDSAHLIFITSATLAILILLHVPFVKGDSHDVLGLGIAAILLLGGPGIYGTTRRITYRIRHLVVINRLSRAMGAVKAGIIPASFGSDMPGDFWDFAKRLVLGYKGPSIVFYSVLIWAVVFSLFLEVGPAVKSAPLAALVGLFIVAFANFTSLLTSWSQLRQEMIATKQEVELGSSTQKSLAEQHCDVADSMMRLRPPRLNDALSHYEIALKLEPVNERAKSGFEKLMGWKVQDYQYKA